jgi:hypothetical protein
MFASVFYVFLCRHDSKVHRSESKKFYVVSKTGVLNYFGYQAISPNYTSFMGHIYLKENLCVKLSLCLTKHYAMKAYGGVDIWIHIILTSALAGMSGQVHAPAALPPGERTSGTHWIGGWVDPSQSLHRTLSRLF